MTPRFVPFAAMTDAEQRCNVDLGDRPWWMSVDQYDPCPCTLPNGHDGRHECEHTHDKPAPRTEENR